MMIRVSRAQPPRFLAPLGMTAFMRSFLRALHLVESAAHVLAPSSPQSRLPSSLRRHADLARRRLVPHGRIARSRTLAHRIGNARIADAALPDAADFFLHTDRGTR